MKIIGEIQMIDDEVGLLKAARKELEIDLVPDTIDPERSKSTRLNSSHT